jgi:hypothetical protein
MRRTPRPLGVSPGATHVVAALYRPGARHGPPVRRRRPAVRAPAEVVVPRWHLRRHRNITGEVLPFKYRRFPLHTLTPQPQRTIRAAAVELRPPYASHDRATVHAPSLDPIEPSRATCCPGRALVVVGAEPPRPPPPALAVRPRRQLLRPNFGYPEALGERVVEPHYLPGRERRRLAGIRLEPPPPHAKDPIASPPFFSGSNPRTEGVSMRF